MSQLGRRRWPLTGHRCRCVRDHPSRSSRQRNPRPQTRTCLSRSHSDSRIDIPPISPSDTTRIATGSADSCDLHGRRGLLPAVELTPLSPLPPPPSGSLVSSPVTFTLPLPHHAPLIDHRPWTATDCVYWICRVRVAEEPADDAGRAPGPPLRRPRRQTRRPGEGVREGKSISYTPPLGACCLVVSAV